MQFEKFPGAMQTGSADEVGGRVMAIGRTFKEALMKGVRALYGKARWRGEDRAQDSDAAAGDASSRTPAYVSTRCARDTLSSRSRR